MITISADMERCDSCNSFVNCLRVKTKYFDYSLLCRKCMVESLRKQLSPVPPVRNNKKICDYCSSVVSERFRFRGRWLICKECNMQIIDKIISYMED